MSVEVQTYKGNGSDPSPQFLCNPIGCKMDITSGKNCHA